MWKSGTWRQVFSWWDSIYCMKLWIWFSDVAVRNTWDHRKRDRIYTESFTARLHWNTVFGRVYQVMKNFFSWACARQNQQNYLCTQWRFRSAWTSTLSDPSSLCTQWVAKDQSFLHADSEDWSDWADAQADLSLHWAHKLFYEFCRAAAQFHFDKYLLFQI